VSVYPKYKKDANGLPIVEGVKALTPAKGTEPLQIPSSFNPDLAKDIVSKNSGISAGTAYAMSSFDIKGDDELARKIAEIDKQTKEQRKRNQMKEAQDKATADFNNSLRGRAWTGLKALTRGLGVVAFTPVEIINSATRNAALQLSTMKNPNAYTKEQKDKIIRGGAINDLNELTIFQIGKQLINEGRIDIGNGFFASETMGAGFKARQAAINTFNVALKDKDGNPVKDKEGRPVLRPYTVATPLAWVLTGGHPESRAGAVIDAIGELAVSFYADPVSKWGKVARAAKLAKAEERTVKGVASAKDAVKAQEVQKQLADTAKAIQDAKDDLFKISQSTAPVKTINQARSRIQDLIEKEVKLKDEFGNLKYDADAITGFLSKDSLTPLIDEIAKTDDAAEIWRLSNKKIDISIADELANAKTQEEVIGVFARNILGAESKVLTAEERARSLALGALESGGLGATTVGRAVKAIPGSTKVAKGVSTVTGKALTGASAATKARAPWLHDFVSRTAASYNTIIPRGAMVHRGDRSALVEAADSWMAVGRVSLEKRNQIINSIITATDDSTAAFNATGKAFDAVYEAAAARGVPKRILDKVYEETRFFKKAEEEMSVYWASRQMDGSAIDVGLANGKNIRLHSSHLDSEFLNSHVYFPPADDLMKLIGVVERYGTGAGRLAADAADLLISNFWKKSVLVRPAFIVRNIMEEQIRVFGTGHVSFYNNPLVAMGMWLGKPEGGAFRRLMSRFDPVKNTVYGSNFRGVDLVEDLSDEAAAVALKNQYIDFMAAFNYGATDDQLGKIISKMDYVTKRFGENGWWDGFASQVQILSNSKIASLVAKVDPNDAKAVDDLVRRLTEGDSKNIWESFVKSLVKENQVADLLNPANAKIFLFESPNSINARIEELAGGLSTVRSLIANGSVKVGDKVITIPRVIDEAASNISKGMAKKLDTNQVFGETLLEAFGKLGKWDNVPLTVPRKRVIKTGRKNQDSAIASKIDGFFSIAVGFEKRTTMGPEWRMTYWDTVGRYSKLLDSDSLTKLKAGMDADLKEITNTRGIKIGASHPTYGKIKEAKGTGAMTLDEIHEIASTEASRKVATLFYNASERRLLFHQLRLIMPFGQAWADTLVNWTKIAFDNPDKVYSIARSASWLNKPASGSIYGLTDARDYYDPNQGFFYNDPQYNARRFFVPFQAMPMNVAANLKAGKGFSVQGPFAASADPMSVNFALQGNGILPGVGPGVTVPFETLNLMGLNPTKKLPLSVQSAINSYLYPYGAPDIQNKGLVEGSLFSNNWSRILGSIAKREETYASAFAPTMGYLAQSGDYNMDDVEDQGRLVRDTHSFAQWFTLMRGLTGALSPTPVAIIPTAIAKDRTGDTQLAATLYKDFNDMRVQNVDPNKAYAEFMDLYGPEAIYAVIGKTSGGPTNLATYELINQDPSVLDEYKDTFSFFYPYGGFSKEMYNWSKINQSKKYLTPNEIMQKVTNIRYYAAKDRLAARAAAEGWSQERFDAGNSELKKSYDITGREVKVDFTKKDRVIAQLEQAAMDPRFDDSDAVAGLRDYLLLRNTAIEASGMKGLKNKASLPQRKWLADQAVEILKRNPEFTNLYYSVFARELKG
jgi:hypothetical protein